MTTYCKPPGSLILPSESVIDDCDLPRKAAHGALADGGSGALALLAQRGAAEEWRIEVAVGGAVAHAHIELGACGQGDEA